MAGVMRRSSTMTAFAPNKLGARIRTGLVRRPHLQIQTGIALVGAVVLSLGIAPIALAGWVNYVNQTSTRMPTGAGQNDPSITTADPEEKDYCWGDVDRDGDIDLICVRKTPFSFAGGKRNVLYMNENGVLIDRASTLAIDSLGVPASEGVSQGFLDLTNDRKSQLVDVNNDGWLDLVTSTSISDGLPRYLGHPRVYINKGQVGGVWQGFRYEYARIPQLLSTTGAIANPRFCSVVAGDVNGDGYVDLYFSDYDSGQVGPAENPNNDMDNKLLINQGAANPGYFTDESVLRMGAMYNYDGTTTKNLLWATFGVEAIIADMNGDGVKDVVKLTTLTAPGIHVAVLTNPIGNVGYWQTVNYKPVYSLSPYFISPGDLNNDGKLDMVVSDEGTDRILLNTGNDANSAPNFTSFPVSSALGVESEFGSQSVIADLNNDGWKDVIISDVDVDTFGCSRRAHIYHNLGNAPNVTLKEESPSVIPTASLTGTYNVAVFDINGDGWRDIVFGRCSSTEVWIATPPAGLAFSYPQGLPASLTPNQATIFQVQLTGTNGGTPVAGSGKIFISVDGAAFVPNSMTSLGGDLYQAIIPATPCPSNVRFYLNGQVNPGAVSFNDPASAGAYYSAYAATGTSIVLNSDFESGPGSWTVTNDPSLTSGAWQVAIPNGTWNEGNRAAPDQDNTPGTGVQAFVTQNGAPGELPNVSDVDGGATTLVSPSINLAGGNAIISVARWFYTSNPSGDALTTSVSNNDGASWVVVNTYTGQPQPAAGSTMTTPNAWSMSSFVLGDYVTPTNQVRVRFVANDAAPAGIVEAGVDDFKVQKLLCAAPCPADITHDGSVNVADMLAVINSWGPCAGCPTDLNSDGVVNVGDLLTVINSWGACP